MKRGFAAGMVFLSLFFSLSIIIMSYFTLFYDPALDYYTEMPKPPEKEVPAPVEQPEIIEKTIHVIELKDNSANPRSITVDSGEKVTWVNKGTSRRRFWIDESIYSETLDPGDNFTYTFTEHGEHSYRDVFNGMISGVVKVNGQQITGNLLGITGIYKDIFGIQIMALIIGLLFILQAHHENC